jgi:hypothetical protein
MYDKSIMALATEIAQHLQSADDADVQFVADWLVNGGDDGSSATDLVLRFSEENELPSKAETES